MSSLPSQPLFHPHRSHQAPWLPAQSKEFFAQKDRETEIKGIQFTKVPPGPFLSLVLSTPVTASRPSLSPRSLRCVLSVHPHGQDRHDVRPGDACDDGAQRRGAPRVRVFVGCSGIS